MKSINYTEYEIVLGNTRVVCFLDDGITCQDESATALHGHYFCEMHYVNKGEVTIQTEERSELLSTGDTVIIPNHILHSTKTSDNPYRTTVSFIAKKLKNGSRFDCASFFEEISEHNDIIIYRGFSYSETIERLLRYYYSNIDHHCKNELISNTLKELLLLMCAGYGKTNDSANHATVSQTECYRSYIMEQFLSDLQKGTLDGKGTIEELAELLHLSIGQTHRIFKTTYSETFRDRVLSIKLGRAKELLENTDIPVVKISEMLGYNMPHSFFTVFKTKVGTTPAKYRDDCKKVVDNINVL